MVRQRTGGDREKEEKAEERQGRKREQSAEAADHAEGSGSSRPQDRGGRRSINMLQNCCRNMEHNSSGGEVGIVPKRL